MADDKPRILVVDDDSDALMYLYQLLSEEGFRVEGSSSALVTIQYVERSAPAVVILDVRMPEMNGLDLLEKIKSMAPKTRVILLSAFVDEGMRSKAMEKGAEELLAKPLKQGALLRALGKVLQENPQ